MKDIIPAKKESPILGLSGLGGGVGGNLVAGLPEEPKYIEEVFSTYLYSGNSTARSIDNGVNLSKGGMTWIKSRNNTIDNFLTDTEQGTSKRIRSNSGQAAATGLTDTLTSFNDNGFSLGTDGLWEVNHSSYTYSSWSFRKAKGFFDVVKYNGSDTGDGLIAHNLGCVPGCIIVKRLNGGSGFDWAVLHRGFDEENPGTHVAWLNLNNAKSANSSYWNNTAPTSTHFCAKAGYNQVNAAGGEYIAYLFAGGASTAATAKSVAFDGSGDYLTTNTSSDYTLGTGDFTIEYWYKISSNSVMMICGGSGTNPLCTYVNGSGFHKLQTAGTDRIVSTAQGTGQWHHAAIVRSSGVTKMYVNGIKEGVDYNDTTDYSSTSFTIGRNDSQYGGTYQFNGELSNFKITKGTALYTSSFRPPTAPLTSTSGTSLLCCNNSSVTGATTGTVTSSGNPTASTVSPFDDPEGFKFGENEDQNIIKTGSYIGNGSTDGPHIECGWEPQWILFKIAGPDGDPWYIADSTRAIVSDGVDNTLLPSSNQAENVGNWTLLDINSTGWKPTTADSKINGSNKEYIYIAMRRPDGYVGKPPEAGTDRFAMVMGNGSGSTGPNFISGWPVDFAMQRNPAGQQSWDTCARLLGIKYMQTNNGNVEANGAGYTWDYMNGFCHTYGTTTQQSWMWKRGSGFDVVAYAGDGVAGRQISHSLNKTVEMIWVKRRNTTGGSWRVGHKGLNGGTNPWEYSMMINSTNAEADTNWTWYDTAPTSTHFTVSADGQVNGGSETFIAMLFASVDGISKVGSYTGTGSAQTITLGFQPRFFTIKKASASGDWYVVDTLRGWPTSENYLQFQSDEAQGPNDFGSNATNGITLSTSSLINNNGDRYIYYAHA